MSKLLWYISVVLFTLFVVSSSYAQKTTERYIPIGKSPGISASHSIVGTITSVDDESHRMTVVAENSTTTITMTAKTRYYLDRSHIKKSSQTGSYEDCEVGRDVEVKVYDDGSADWVKIKTP